MTTLVLDGHVAHWWPAEPSRISRVATRTLQEADELAVTAISWFGLGWPAGHGRIIVTIPIRSWLDHLAAQVQTLPLTPATTATLGVWRSRWATGRAAEQLVQRRRRVGSATAGGVKPAST